MSNIAHSYPLPLSHNLLSWLCFCSLHLHCSPMCFTHVSVWGCHCHMFCCHGHLIVPFIFITPPCASPTFWCVFIPSFSFFLPQKKPAGDLRCTQQVSEPCCVPPTHAFASPVMKHNNQEELIPAVSSGQHVVDGYVRVGPNWWSRRSDFIGDVV